MKSYNLNNLELYTKHKDTFQQYELLRYNEIKNYYKGQFDEIKLRQFMCKIYSSKVFKEAFEFFWK